MRKRKKLALIAVVTVLLILSVCGSFWDYEIANALYWGQQPKENFFGILFAFIGVIPTFVGWSFLGASVLCLSKKQVCGKIKRRWLFALSILLFVLSFFYFCNTLLMVNNNAFSVHWAIAYPIGIAVIFCAALLGYRLSQKSDNPDLLKTALLLTVVSLVTMLIIMSTKEIMNRPRFRWVMETGDPVFFRNWWQSGKAIKASFGAEIVSDEFSSFPSGHSAYAMFAIFLFPALADYVTKLQKYRGALFVVGFIWWGLTALSRLTVGAHYLTDVCIAGLATILTYQIAILIRRLVMRKKDK